MNIYRDTRRGTTILPWRDHVIGDSWSSWNNRRRKYCFVASPTRLVDLLLHVAFAFLTEYIVVSCSLENVSYKKCWRYQLCIPSNLYIWMYFCQYIRYFASIMASIRSVSYWGDFDRCFDCNEIYLFEKTSTSRFNDQCDKLGRGKTQKRLFYKHKCNHLWHRTNGCRRQQ